MEEVVFRLPAVAGVLRKEFIEARLHTDGGPKEKENVQRQTELAGSRATPIYVIVDPKSGEKLRVRAGWMSGTTFLRFLRGQPLE
jgi:hypothetical protein